jgi:aldehyde dehydrogenase (NAD+)
VALRVRCLRQLQAGHADHADELRAMTIAETGSPLFFTRSAALDEPVASLAWVADLAEGYEWTTDLGAAEPLGMPARRWVRREPTGVVAAITPWNVPHQINLAKLGPALAAGNTVVLKPAPDTPWCATVVGRLIAEETDIPPGW